ncbi:hypothetical protein F4814DRAFT_416998 [Daldinia grandis]|nr:hypothetical protein F4814DRAFT_416998 [Daldinia grandis]
MVLFGLLAACRHIIVSCLPTSPVLSICICTMLVYPLVLMHSRMHTVRMYVYVRYHQRQLRMSRSNFCDPGRLT